MFDKIRTNTILRPNNASTNSKERSALATANTLGKYGLSTYGKTLPDELLLGFICWYTIMDPQITRADLVKLYHQQDALDPDLIPNPPRPGDAFKRACRYSERTNLPIGGSPNTANIMIRSVRNTSTELDRHMVLEVVDPEGKHLSYHTVAEFTFARGTGELKTVTRKTGDPDIDSIITSSITYFHDQVAKASKFLDPQVIRRMIREQLERMNAISVRRQGSVYFYPVAARAQGEALVALCKSFNSGSAFHALPLIDDEQQREMVKHAFEEEIHEESMQLVSELRRFQQEGKELTATAWNEYRKRHEVLTARAKDYEKIVNFEVSKSETELEMLKTSVDNFLIEGLVKLDD